MIQSPLMSWTLTMVFAATSAWCLVGCLRPSAAMASAAHRISHLCHAAMGAAMLAMIWPWGAIIPAPLQVIVFMLAAIWFLALALHARRRIEIRKPLHHALMMAAMSGMILAMPATMTMCSSGTLPQWTAFAGASGALALLSIALAAYFTVTALSWIGIERALLFAGQHAARPNAALASSPTPDAICHSAMSAGMGLMLLAMLPSP